MNKNTILLAAVFLALGVIAGRQTSSSATAKWSFGGKNKKADSTSETAHGALSRETVSSAHSETEIATLQSLSGLYEPTKDGPLVVVPASLIGTLKSHQTLSTLPSNLFQGDDTLLEQLQISDREKAQIQKSWRQLRRVINNSETSAAQASDKEDGSVSITVNDQSATLAQISESFRRQSYQTLGENRAETFLALKQVDKMISNYQGEQAYLIEMDAVGNGQWRYRIQAQRGKEPKQVVVTRSIPYRLRHLTDKFGIPAELSAIIEDPEE